MTRIRRRIGLMSSLATSIAFGALLPSPVEAADKTDLATATLDLGGSIAKLVWVGAPLQQPTNPDDADHYRQLAEQVQQQIEIGRSSSTVMKSTFDVIGTAAVYTAVADPEPLSKGVAGFAAWGAKKTGDALGDMILEQSQTQARAILASGLKNSGFSRSELRSMSPDGLGNKVDKLRIGNQTIGAILVNDPQGLDMLRANAIDIATSIGAEALSEEKGTHDTVASIQTELAATTANISAYQKDASDRLDALTTSLGALQQETAAQNQKLDALSVDVAGNTAAIRSLADVSYMGWTTSQKLQAVNAGLFPDLSPTQRSELTTELESQQRRDDLISDIKGVTEDLGNLAAIGHNLGLPPNVVKGIQGAQVVASGIAQFATGNYLGAIASVTSLIGFGGQDAAAKQQAMMMEYLQKEFSQLNQKLDKVIDLQIDTIKSIQALADDETKFHQQVFSQLDRIEDAVISSQQISQAILLDKWQPCQAFVNGTALNGQYRFTSQDALIQVITSPGVSGYAGQCYDQMVSFLDAWVKPATWSGQIISAGNFPSSVISNDKALSEQMDLFQKQRIVAFNSARDFLILTLSKNTNASPVSEMVRLSLPAQRISDQVAISSSLSSSQGALSGFTCDDHKTIGDDLAVLLCFGLAQGSSGKPTLSRFQTLTQAALLGPQVYGVIDTGVALSNIAGLAREVGTGTFAFPSKTDIINISTNGLTLDMTAAIAEKKGQTLLSKLSWLTEAMVMQQSIAYGDYVPALIEQSLYNKKTRILDAASADQSVAPAAVAAMRSNPILARNVLLLALRHSIADQLGGQEQADNVLYRQSTYRLGVQDLGSHGCGGDTNASAVLQSLFPGYSFSFHASTTDKKNSAFSSCPDEFLGDASGAPALGRGAAVEFEGFYIQLPSAPALSNGILEQTDTLRQALLYRDRVNQARIDLNLKATASAVASAAADPKAALGIVSRGLLDEGWAWAGQAKSSPAATPPILSAAH